MFFWYTINSISKPFKKYLHKIIFYQFFFYPILKLNVIKKKITIHRNNLLKI